MPQQVNKKINGKKYTIWKLNTTVGLNTALSLAKLILPSVGATIDGIRHDDVLHGSPKTFSEVATNICMQLDKIDITELISLLLEESTCEGKEYDFEDHFSGNYGELIEVLEWALRENFESFFTAKGIGEKLMKGLSLLSNPVPESTSQESSEE